MKIKLGDGGYVNWYRVTDQGQEGWQAGKPADYAACPYVGAINPFDSELVDDTVYWPEGEKDCETLADKSLPAFTFGGTGDGLPEGALEFLRGRHLIILADNDSSGRAHAIKKAQLAHGVAASVKLLEFPELPPGGDVSDFLKANPADALEDRVELAPLWAPAEGEIAPQDVAYCRRVSGGL